MAYSVDVKRAQEFAAEKHKGQLDKAGAPYIGHLCRVASRLQDPACQVVAWLHDTMEDQNVTFDELEVLFGEETARTVQLMTRRGEAYDDYIQRLKGNPVARAVKVSDLIDNSNLSRLQTVGMEDVERQAKYNRALMELVREEAQ